MTTANVYSKYQPFVPYHHAVSPEGLKVRASSLKKKKDDKPKRHERSAWAPDDDDGEDSDCIIQSCSLLPAMNNSRYYRGRAWTGRTLMLTNASQRRTQVGLSQASPTSHQVSRAGCGFHLTARLFFFWVSSGMDPCCSKRRGCLIIERRVKVDLLSLDTGLWDSAGGGGNGSRAWSVW